MTCNAEFDRDESTAKNVVVGNFYGESFKVADAGSSKAWDAMGTAGDEILEWFEKDDASIIEDGYKTEYASRRRSEQSCVAVAKMYETGDEELNGRYWAARDGDPAILETGFRVWESSSERQAEYAADAPPVAYQLYDFPGIERPPEPEPEETGSENAGGELDGKSGALTLSAAATALIAVLITF